MQVLWSQWYTLLSRKMKDDFQRLEDDMGHLNSRVVEIQDSSNSINTALADRKQQINKLSSVHHLLKKVSSFTAFSVSLLLCCSAYLSPLLPVPSPLILNCCLLVIITRD